MKHKLMCIVIIAIVFSTFFMFCNTSLVGDEVVTYGMANSSSGGWMLSKGRVVEYFQNEILGESFWDTGHNLILFAQDILKNRRQAAYFSYERPSESGWYGKEQIKNWFYVTSENRFTFVRVYLNAMGDDANSFLYYMLVHLISSLFPLLSGTKWSAFLVNMLCLIGTIVLLCRICRKFSDSEKCQLGVCFIYIFSVSCLHLSTYLRPYMLTTMLQLALFLLHLKLYEAIGNNNVRKFKQYILLLFLLYPIGYVAHYTTGLWAVMLGIMTLLFIFQNQNFRLQSDRYYYLVRYFVSGIGAMLMGILIDPVSVLGLASKLSGTGGNVGNACLRSINGFVGNVFGNWFICVLVIGILFAAWIYNMKANQKKGKSETGTLFCDNKLTLRGLGRGLLAYCVLVTLATKGGYFRAIYPLISMVAVLSLSAACEVLIPKQKNRRGLLYMLTILYIGSTMISMNSQTLPKREYVAKWQQIFEQADTNELILLRNHAEGYEHFQQLGRYERVLFITTTDDDMEALLTKEYLKPETEYTVLVSNGEAEEKAFKKAIESGMGLEFIEEIYDDTEEAVFKIKTDELQ